MLPVWFPPWGIFHVPSPLPTIPPRYLINQKTARLAHRLKNDACVGRVRPNNRPSTSINDRRNGLQTYSTSSPI
jgi:hypothetical protein